MIIVAVSLSKVAGVAIAAGAIAIFFVMCLVRP